jgi:hypothetical protein
MDDVKLMLELLDALCVKLVDREIWDLSKDAEQIKSLLTTHGELLEKFAKLVEGLHKGVL